MSLSFNPRYYQQDAVNAIWKALKAFSDNPCAELPTGAGKSWVLAMLAHDATTRWGGRVLILAHRKELLEQNHEKIAALLPDEISLGIYSAGLKSRDKDAQVLVAGIQSVYGKACDLGGFDLVIVDEAHLIPPDGDGMYQTLINDLKQIRPHVRIVGLTATPYRLKGGRVCRPQNILNRICYRVSVAELIEKGHLCPIYSNEAHARADTSGLHIRNGEFIAAEADELMNDPELVRRAVEELLERTRDRRKVLVFAQSIAHGEAIRGLISDAGHDCEGVYGHTSAVQRDLVLQEFKDGQIKYLVNCEVLTTGFDAPDIDCVGLLRPTASAALYYQMVGRGFRIHPGKQNCLILDFAGNILRHGPVDELSQKMEDKADSGKSGDTPMKTCPECANLVNISVMICPICEYEWPQEQAAGHGDRPSSVPILSTQRPARPKTKYTLERVQNVTFKVHKKKDTPDDHPKVLRVLYEMTCGEISEWVCFEHKGYALHKAHDWWFARTGSTQYPRDVPDAKTEAEMLLARSKFKLPAYILTKQVQDEKWPEIAEIVMPEELSDWKPTPGYEPVCPTCYQPVFPQMKRRQCWQCLEWYNDGPAMLAEDDGGFGQEQEADEDLEGVPF